MLTTISINKSESGWPSAYSPSSDDIKAYLLGWRMCNSDGTAPYVSGDKYWQRWNDASIMVAAVPTTGYPDSEQYTAIVANETGEAVAVTIGKDIRVFRGETTLNTPTPAEMSLEWEEIEESIEDRLTADHKYIIYMDGKANDTGVLDVTLTATDGVTTETATAWTDADTNYTRKYIIFTPTTTANWQLKLSSSYTASTPIDYTFRKPVIIDLTKEGELPVKLQELYGVTNWEDMTNEQLIAYFDSIGFVPSFKSGNVDIGGVSAIMLINTGINLLDTTFESGDIDSTGNIEDIAKIRTVDKVPIQPNTAYIFSNNKSYTTIVAHYYDEAEDYVGSASIGVAAFTTPNTAKFIRLVATGTDTTILGQLEEGTVSTTYTAPRTDSVTIPATVKLLALNGKCNEVDINLGLYIKRLESETVTVSSGSATTLIEGTGNCKLYSATGVEYSGTISGTTVTTAAPDGNYTIIYELATEVYENVTIDRSNWNFGSNNQLLAKVPLIYDINGNLYYNGTDNYAYNRVNILEI